MTLHSPNPPPPPLLYKGRGVEFFKNGCKGGWGEDGKFLIFYEKWRKPGMGGLFYNGGDGKSLYIVGRGVLTPLLYEDPHHYTPYHPRLFF